MEEQIFISSYLYHDEEVLIKEKLSKLDTRSARSLKKLVRALLFAWLDGDIELSSEEILILTPDRRFKPG